MATTIDSFIVQLIKNMENLGSFVPALVCVIEAYLNYRHSWVNSLIDVAYPHIARRVCPRKERTNKTHRK